MCGNDECWSLVEGVSMEVEVFVFEVVLIDLMQEKDEEFKDCQFVIVLVCGLELLCCFMLWESLLGNQELVKKIGLLKLMVLCLIYILIWLGYLCYLLYSGKY